MTTLRAATKAQIKNAKQIQQGIMAECDKALSDLNFNIKYLQDQKQIQTDKRKTAEEVLMGLEADFPTL